MKKVILFLLAAAIVFSLTACGGQTDAQPETNENERTQTTQQTPRTENDSSVTEQTPQGDNAGAAQPSGTYDGTEQTDTSDTGGETKLLVIYFSSANTADVNAVSGATPVVDGLGATEYLAELIHSQVGGDIAKITPVKDYPLDYNGTADAAKSERDNDERPAFQALDVNPEDYDVIFVGYPIWWYTRPMLIYSFFDAYDFSGKTVIPFNTHAGSGDGGTYEEIRQAEPGATVPDGFAIAGSRVDSGIESDVLEWLVGLEY
ncbi:MAG: hypothetical protein IJ072_03850 [Oscillospiraceae bacterium]|nr:hypothetical protein [Oscillospiraceae bacterium]